MQNAVLVLNAGSSSIKFALYALTQDGGVALHARGQVAGIGVGASFKAESAAGAPLPVPAEHAQSGVIDHGSALNLLLAWLDEHTGGLELAAVGHRVVHGGRHRTTPALVDTGLLDELGALARLAPHHQPHNLAAIRVLAGLRPGLAQVACFDTAFHAGQDDVVRRLPLPQEYEERGLMRYGFHGLSYEYLSSELVRRGLVAPQDRVLLAHLGNGASLCGVLGGRGIATSMSFSTLDGLMMGTRCGGIDPGVLLHLMHEDGIGEDALTDLLYNRSGLLGVSGISSDMQVLLRSETVEAARAVELYVHTLVKEVGAMVAQLRGLDVLVFAGGVGEHAATIRARVCNQLDWLGVVLDSSANEVNAERISAVDSPVHALVIPTDEELVIARHTLSLIQARAG